MINRKHGKGGKRIHTLSSAEREVLPAAAYLRILLSKLKRIGLRARTVAREVRKRNFPESNRILIQLILFLVGQSGMLASLLHERMHDLRRKSIHAAGKRESALRRARRFHPAYFVSGALALAVIVVFCSFFTLGTVVTYDGDVVDTVDNSRIAKRAVDKIESITAETLGEASYTIDTAALQCSASLVRRSDVTDKTTFEQELAEELGQVSYGYSLYVNEELIGSTQYEGALEDLLEQIKQIYTSRDTLEISFVESVRIAEGYVPTDSIMNLGRIAEILNSTKSGETTYTVVKGDTWGAIANSHGMSSAELEVLNPGYDINRLNIGDVLTLSNAVPYLTVTVKERQNYVDDVDFDITYEDDSSLYKGDYRVITKGQYGTADIVADVTYINGAETERTEISRVMLTAPVTEHRAKGTKERPSWYPTGNFRWPCSGRITSYFGYRNTGIRGATRNHQGIDISCSYGTAVYAADGGRVTFSGYKGAMGYVVIIDHQNGFQTYYEHNSKLLVSAGTTVHKGQQIAKAGSTGVSSGTHCHFGVMRNGSYVNPLKYLP